MLVYTTVILFSFALIGVSGVKMTFFQYLKYPRKFMLPSQVAGLVGCVEDVMIIADFVLSLSHTHTHTCTLACEN